jgi:ABC-type glycerol-3-phosphate transport system substrate-binding protein
MTAALPTRRSVLRTAALASTVLATPFVRGAHAAGKLSVGFWDHWVPGANDSLTKLCHEWADKNKLDITIDYITSQGDKLTLTKAAEAQAGSGHDLLQFSGWDAASYTDHLVQVDDIVNPLIKEHGKLLDGSIHGGRQKGHWYAVPAARGTIAAPCCARIDLFKKYVGLDVTKMYPADAPPDKTLADAWTWDAFLVAAEKCFKGGYPFGLPLSTFIDAVSWTSSVFAGNGAVLVDEEGNITVKSDATKETLEWFKKIVPFLPPSVFAWDNSGNNKWLDSGKGSLIQNPPSAWAVAVRDRPEIGKQLWIFPSPKGPKGRFVGTNAGFYGIWNFSHNQSAAKSLIRYLSTRSAIQQLVEGSKGYDIPPYDHLRDFKTWSEEGPPTGVNYNYPPRGDVISLLVGSPAPANIASHLYAQGTVCKLVARYAQEGKSMDQAIAETEEEIEGYTRS